MAKRKKRASINSGSARISKNIPLAQQVAGKQKLKTALLGIEGISSLSDLDAQICRPDGYSERIFKYGSLGRAYELYEEVNNFIGIGEVREVFRNWLKAMDLTISSVSNFLYPEKSASYLSTILNSDNKKSYPDKFVNDVFNQAKVAVETGIMKINGETIQNKALIISEKLVVVGDLNDVDTTESQDIEMEGELNMNYLVVTNFATKKQKVVSIGDVDFKVLNDFFLEIKDVIGAKGDDLVITPISTETKSR